MRVSAAIMAHPEREDQVDELRAMLDGPVSISWDDEGPASGNSDRVWRNARRAWGMFDPGADWHILIQDDALPCADFLAGMTQALERVPRTAIVSAYLGKGRAVPGRWARMAQEADQRGAAWVRTHKLMWGVCLAAPTMMIPAMIEWCDRRAGVPDDMRVSGYATYHHREVWYTWPSLVDHRRVTSLTKHRASDRVAQRHYQGSALDIDWDRPVVTDPMLTIKHGPRSGPSRLRDVRSVR